MSEEKAARPLGDIYLNCAPGFWEAYHLRPGMARRKVLLTIFRQHPTTQLPVNNKWQANMADPDLRYLMKKGVLCQVRDRGGRRHPMNKTSAKRQSYLVLAQPPAQEAA